MTFRSFTFTGSDLCKAIQIYYLNMNYRNWQPCHWYLLNDFMTKVPVGHFLPQSLTLHRHTHILGRFSAEFRDSRWIHVFSIPQRSGTGGGSVGASDTQLKPPRQSPACTTETQSLWLLRGWHLWMVTVALGGVLSSRWQSLESMSPQLLITTQEQLRWDNLESDHE